MKFSQLLEARRQNWQQLEQLCVQLENRSRQAIGPAALSQFAALYRAACADLALADSYQLPPNTTQYLHQLVGRAHNQLYRSRTFQFKRWSDRLLHDVPRTVFHDRCVQVAFLLFWGVFLLSALLAASPETWPGYTEKVCSQDFITQLEDSFSEPISGRPPEVSIFMVAFYIQHNTTIALQCFAGGLLVVPGIMTTVFNAALLGAAFGHMTRVPEGDNFYHFVTAHGPFELTAIVLSSGAGLRLGMAWLTAAVAQTRSFLSGAPQPEPDPDDKLLAAVGFGMLSRSASLRRTGRAVMPVIGAAMILMSMAALIEGCLSPSSLPYWTKAAVAIICTLLLLFYFVVLGYPRKESDAA